MSTTDSHVGILSSTTTSHLQIKPDYFISAEACTASERTKNNTNSRYKFFNQTHFTAGDSDQFEEYLSLIHISEPTRPY